MSKNNVYLLLQEMYFDPVIMFDDIDKKLTFQDNGVLIYKNYFFSKGIFCPIDLPVLIACSL